MRTINSDDIVTVVARMCRQANYVLPDDMLRAVERAAHAETSETGRTILSQILENARIAARREMALCQDTGVAEVFVTLGSNVAIKGLPLADAVQKGVALGYTTGYLRASMVADPLRRVNTGDNTPAAVYIDIVPGDTLSVTILPKGGGTENASMLAMLQPNAGVDGVVDCVVAAVRSKGESACPPLVVGVGIGGTFSTVAGLAKKALLRPLGAPAADAYYGALEQRILSAVNALGIGPMGLGGVTTALAVHIRHAPCHIASLPVAVSMQCHCLRRMTEVIS